MYFDGFVTAFNQFKVISFVVQPLWHADFFFLSSSNSTFTILNESLLLFNLFDMNKFKPLSSSIAFDMNVSGIACTTCITWMLQLKMWFLIQSLQIRKYFDLKLWITANFNLTCIWHECIWYCMHYMHYMNASIKVYPVSLCLCLSFQPQFWL